MLVLIFKGKDSKSVCDSYQDTTLIEYVGKVFVRILFNRLINNIYPLVIPESHRVLKQTGILQIEFIDRTAECIGQRIPLYEFCKFYQVFRHCKS